MEELKRAGLRANVVSRIMVSPTKMKELLDALNDNYNSYKQIKKD